MKKTPGTTTFYFRFFDVTVQLTCDSVAYILPFVWMYRRLLVSAQSVSTPTLRIDLYTGRDNVWRSPALVIDDDIWPIHDPAGLQGMILVYVLHSIIARVRTHILIHAGVLVRGGRAVMLVGDSQHGKTTLVLKLIQQGFRVLSDELAAIGRHDGLIYPFPRCLRVRPGSLEKVGFPQVAHRSFVWLDKLLLDVEAFAPGHLSDPALPGDIVLLQDPEFGGDADASHRASTDEILRLTIARADAGVVNSLRSLDGISGIGVEVTDPYLVLHIRAERPSSVLEEIRALCQAQRVLLFDVQKRLLSQPSFREPARIEPMRPSEMVVELLRRFEATHLSDIVQTEHNGSGVGLFMELAELISGVRCHRLYVGPLQQMADHVCRLSEESAAPHPHLHPSGFVPEILPNR